MDEILAQIMNVLDANEGRVDYGTLIESLDFSARSKAYNALREGKRQGVLRKFVTRNPDNGQVQTIVEKVV